MPSIDSHCHELRIPDNDQTWRVVYSIEPDAIVVLEVFSIKSRTTPKYVSDNAKSRLRRYRTIR
ncbi:MAG: phage-related protein [Rhodothermales bacterium]|jgi:phage-related protein